MPRSKSHAASRQALTVREKADAIIIRSPWWQVQHRRGYGGCFCSIRFTHGSGKNLLSSPVTSAIRLNTLLGLRDPETPIFPIYHEHFDSRASVTVKQSPDCVAVIAEGTYRDEKGADVGVRFRHRYEYRQWGLVTTELEIIPDKALEGVLEVSVVNMALRPGLTHAYVRQHPATNPNVDLRGGFEWHPLQGKPVFRGRYCPIHIVCFEKGVEGIEMFPTSDLAEWDTGLSPSEGLGLYVVSGGGPRPTTVLFNPYAIGFRRVPITIDKPIRFRLNFGLPSIKPADTTAIPYFHMGADSRWPSDDDLVRASKAGVKLIRFHNDYREDGPFWHDGAYPPYDAGGMHELRRIINTSHHLGMKIVPYISVKELHPDAPGYQEHANEWAQVPAPTVRDIHTWYYTGEFGRLMCLQSGWLERRKRDVDTILSDLDWDGLYFDWTKPLPCCHEKHLPGRYHTDTDAYLEFLFYCRQRVGPKGIMFLHLSGYPYMIAENLSDVTFIYEDVGNFFPAPNDYPVHCRFVPIVSRYLATGAAGGSVDARRLIMGSLLNGQPTACHLDGGYGEELLVEQTLFANEDLSQFRLCRCEEKPVETGRENVYASIWHNQGRAMIYLANFSDKSSRGTMRFDPAAFGFKNARSISSWRMQTSGRAKSSIPSAEESPRASLVPRSLKTTGLPYSLGPWGSAMVHLSL